MRFDMDDGLPAYSAVRLGCCECSCDSEGIMDAPAGEEYEGMSMSIRYGNVGLPIWLEFAPRLADADCIPWEASSSRCRFAVLLIGMLRAAEVMADVCRSPEIGMEEEDVLAVGDTRMFDR